MIGSLLGAILPSVMDVVSEFVEDKDQKAQLEFKLKTVLATQEHDFQMSQIELKKAQIDVNAKEAQNRSVWVAGWRPAIGWVCAVSLAYIVIGRDLAQVILDFTAVGVELPPAQTELLWHTMFGMLGLGGLRSWEKLKGLAR